MTALKNNKHLIWAVTGIYTLSVFVLAATGRDIASFLKERGWLGLSVGIVFGLTFILMGPYLIRQIKGFTFPRFIFLFILISLFTFTLWQIPKSVEKFHFLEFGLLPLLLRKSFSWKFEIKQQYILAFLLTAFIGACDEVFQLFLPKRYFDWRDIGFNALAGFYALAGYEIFHNSLFRKKE